MRQEALQGGHDLSRISRLHDNWHVLPMRGDIGRWVRRMHEKGHAEVAQSTADRCAVAVTKADVDDRC